MRTNEDGRTTNKRTPRVAARMIPVFFLLSALLLSHSLTLCAADRPSVFRGVVVTDSPLGVRVVSVDGGSQAATAGLQPEDVIVRINSIQPHSIDEFAALSVGLRGHTVKTSVVVFREGQPIELTLHLFSYPVLRTWGLEFVPDDDVRFAEPRTGWDYWTRLGRAFEQVGKSDEALNAHLNALHNAPTEIRTAVTVTELLMQVSRRRLAGGLSADGVAYLRRSLALMQRLFDQPLTDAQLDTLKRRLKDTLDLLHSLPSQGVN